MASGLASVQIIDNLKIIEIMRGDEMLGTMVFDPDDFDTYKKFMDIISLTHDGGKTIRDIKLTDEESAAMEKSSDSLEEFKAAESAFDKYREMVDVSVSSFDKICSGLDEIFGEGVCAIFTQGRKNIKLLNPLFESAMPFFKESRDEKVKPYLKK